MAFAAILRSVLTGALRHGGSDLGVAAQAGAFDFAQGSKVAGLRGVGVMTVLALCQGKVWTIFRGVALCAAGNDRLTHRGVRDMAAQATDFAIMALAVQNERFGGLAVAFNAVGVGQRLFRDGAPAATGQCQRDHQRKKAKPIRLCCNPVVCHESQPLCQR